MADILPFPGLTGRDVQLLRDRYGLILIAGYGLRLRFVQAKPRAEDYIRIEHTPSGRSWYDRTHDDA